MAADIVFLAVGSDHHGKSVPANKALDLSFDFLIARQGGLLAYVDRIYVRSVCGKRNLHTGSKGPIADFLQDPGRLPRLALLYDRIE